MDCSSLLCGAATILQLVRNNYAISKQRFYFKSQINQLYLLQQVATYAISLLLTYSVAVLECQFPGKSWVIEPSLPNRRTTKKFLI